MYQNTAYVNYQLTCVYLIIKLV